MKKITKNLIVAAIAVVVIAIGFVWAIIDFTGKLNTMLEQDTYEILNQTSYTQRIAIQSKIDSQFRFLTLIADQIATKENSLAKDGFEALNQIMNDDNFTAILLAGVDGVARLQDGQIVNLWEREYYQRALTGKNTISNPINSLLSGDRVIMFAVPIINKDTGTVDGVLAAQCKSETFDRLMIGDENTYSESASFLVNSTGDLVTHARCPHININQGSIQEFFSDTSIDQPSAINKILTEISESRSGRTSFNYNGSHHYISYQPTGLNDWYIFSMISSDAINSQAQDINSLLMWFSARISMAFALLLIYVFINNYFSEKAIKKQSAAVKATKQELDAVVSNVPSGIFRYTANDKAEFDFISEGVAAIWHMNIDDYRKQFNNTFFDTIQQGDLARVRAAVKQAIISQNSYAIQYRITNATNETRWVYCQGKFARDSEGDGWVYASVSDVTNKAKHEISLEENAKRYRILAEQSDGVLFDYSVSNQTIVHSANFYDKYMRDPHGVNFPESAIANGFIYHEDAGIIRALFDFDKPLKGIREAEMRLVDGGGNVRWAKTTLSILIDEEGRPVKAIGKINDIDKRKRHMEKLAAMATIDQLTGLTNKASATQQISEYLTSDDRDYCVLLALDLDGFKAINDTFGHLAGDSVLSDFAAILKRNFRSTDIVSRFGGDEFTVLIKNVSDKEFVFRACERIITEISSRNFGNEDQLAKVSTSIGIYFIAKFNTGFLTAYHNADSALYDAKSSGKSCYCVYDESAEQAKDEDESDFNELR